MRQVFLSIAFLILICSSLFAQEDSHDHEGHHHHSFEIGIANAPVYFLNEKEWTYGLHLHGIYTFPHSKWGIGLGYEQIFDEHEHKTFGVVGSFRPIPPISIILSPGITMENGEDEPGHSEESEILFAAHFEVAYEFLFGDFHIGPVSEVAYDPEDIHLSLGLHIGYGF